MIGNTSTMKRLVDIDDKALEAAHAALGTQTIKDTVNQALALAAQSSSRVDSIAAALDRLAEVALPDDERAAACR